MPGMSVFSMLAQVATFKLGSEQILTLACSCFSMQLIISPSFALVPGSMVTKLFCQLCYKMPDPKAIQNHGVREKRCLTATA